MADFLKNVRHDLRMYWLGWRTQFKAVTALRGAFIIQVVGMIINNIGLMVAWLFLFERFGTINGWGLPEFIGVQGVNMIIFGVVILFNTGIVELPRYVDTGSFDSFLTKPSSILMQLSSSSIEVATLGDLALGVVLLAWYAVFAQVSLLALALFFLSLLLGILLMWCFTLWPFILAFYMYDSDRWRVAFRFSIWTQVFTQVALLAGRCGYFC